jgi:hypothetical protein
VNPPDSDPHPGRLFASRALVVLASVAIMLALVVAYARQAGVDSNQFANRATVALRDDSVRSLIAEKVTDELVLKNEADLIAARPIIESVASEIVGGRAFTSLFRKAVRDVHRALFKRDENTVTLTLADVGTVIAAALEQVRPALADELQSTRRVLRGPAPERQGAHLHLQQRTAAPAGPRRRGERRSHCGRPAAP